MRRIGKTLAALTLAGSGVALAVVGGAPAMAGGGSGQNGLVNIATGDVIVNPNVTTGLAAVICGIDVDVITALASGQKTDCKNMTKTTGKQHWIVKK